MKPTDTPQTDAIQFQKKPINISIENEMLRALSRQLERELAESQADVEFWKAKAYEAEEMEGKHEAKVERLSKLTEDCLNVIRVYCPTYYNDAMERFNKTNK